MHKAASPALIAEQPISLLMTNHMGRLLLAPRHPHAVLDPQALQQWLATFELIGAMLDRDPTTGIQSFARGARFFDWIGFTGCAVQLGETDTTAGCHLRLWPLLPTPRLVYGRNSRAPCCQQCRKRAATSLQSLIDTPDCLVICSHCGHRAPAWNWDWRGQAGYARIFCSIEDIFPGEVAPLPALLTQLDQHSGIAWHWFVVQDSDTSKLLIG